jgi:cytochrome P450
MSDQQIPIQLVMLAFAGHETVTNLIGNGMIALWWYPDQRRELVSEASLVRNAVEEMLRWDNPAPLEGRWTTHDVELHGTLIPADTRVMLVMGAATHDDRVYELPELFDIHRQIDRPLGFGFGMHLCLGANLARMEARIAFEEFLTRFPEWDVDVSGVSRGSSPSFRGHAHIPIVVR